jgi:outer membrane protein TolC
MAFYDLYATQRGLEIDRETIRLLQDIEQTASSMYRVGEGRQSDVLRAQVEVARMAADSIRMRSMLTAMAASLDALRGRPTGSGIAIPVLPAFPDSAPALTTLQDIAEASRPMIRAGVNEVHAATAGEKLAAKEIWPDLQVGVQYGQRGGEMGTERMGSLMLGASVPVFAKSRQNRMRDEAGAMRLMAEADLAAMRSETRARVASTHAALTRARALSRLYRSTLILQAEATAASALAA